MQHLVFVDLPPAAFVKEERLLMFPAGGSAESVFSLRNMCQRLDVCRRKAAWEKQAFGVTMFDRRRRATESTPSAEGTFKKRKNNNSRQKSETEKKTVFRFYHFCHEGKKNPKILSGVSWKFPNGSSTCCWTKIKILSWNVPWLRLKLWVEIQTWSLWSVPLWRGCENF